ncbi:MAG: 30S ribosomal protein S6 [Candidatus Gastranaerophilales bacterium]|nr:30S ribosomal protein S6 [Candidatus Gastranaerophilales bacterium]
MKKYELLSIIKPNLDIEEVDKVLSQLEETIKNLGGTITNTDKIGRKKLAYDIDNYRDGFYTVTKLELPQEAIKTLKRNLKLNDNFLRDMIIEDVETKAQA